MFLWRSTLCPDVLDRFRRADHPNAPSYTCIKLTGAGVRTEILAMNDKYDHIVIDAGGRDTTSQRAALSISQKLLIPCKPRSFDLWAIENVAQLVEERVVRVVARAHGVDVELLH